MHRITLGVLAALIALPASAATIVVGYDRGIGGSQDPTFPKPIDHSTFLLGFTQTSGLVQWGMDAEMFQNGRAGLASDKVTAHMGHTFKLGPFAMAADTLAGYARGPNLDYGILGGELRGSIPTPVLTALSTELAVRRRQSFAVNYFPNMVGSNLPTNPWRETRFSAAEVWRINPHVALALHGGIDRGSNPDSFFGVETRLTF